MNTQHHEVSIKIINSYQSMEVINAFYSLIECGSRNIRIVHRYYPDTCRRDVQVFAEERLVKTHTFEVMHTDQVSGLINAQIRSDNQYMVNLVLRDVYNFLQANAIEHQQRLLDQVKADYREVDPSLVELVRNIS
ncbi:hypothetical protein [Pseudomonas phage D6]|nr:hypothetical protein [Pseudomonas phage D6]